jgi:prolyl oligopeptidase (EC:3.4.21.26). Serine peptidase. MEROPS family S09A
MSYPETRKGDVVDTYFGTEVADPYRWLEDDRSEETENWVKAQNEVTFAHLESIPYREKIETRLTELWNYEKISAPFKEGDYTYFYKNDGLQNQYVVYRQKGDEEPKVFLDPNTFSEDGTTSLAQLTFSDDGSLAAYSISEGGSDWRKIRIIDAETKEQLEDPLVDVKFSGVSWVGNEGFYYSSYDKPEGSELSAKTASISCITMSWVQTRLMINWCLVERTPRSIVTLAATLPMTTDICSFQRLTQRRVTNCFKRPDR